METPHSNATIAHQHHWNLHQQPIRVEILTSPFSEPIYYNENYGVVRHFIGVNAEIIKVLSTLMNFSGKFI